MKQIIITLLSIFFITPCLSNIHINPDTVESVVKEFVSSDKIDPIISEYNTQLKASNGTGISAQGLWDICVIAGWDIKKSDGESKCQDFVNTMVRNASINFYHACDKKYKGKPNYICVDDFFTNKAYGGTQVNLIPGQALAKEYARLKHNDSTVQCRNKFDPGTLDDTLMCTSHNQNRFYEFVFDDLEEPKDKKIQDSIQSAICRMYDAKPTTAGCTGGGTNVSGTSTCWSASCAADSAKCAKINQSMAKFGYTAEYKNGKCEINFNTIRNTEELKTAYGIDNFVFCHGIQVTNAPNVETYLKQYVAERAGVSASSVKCDSGFNTYTGSGCAANGITDIKDDIKTCRVGDKQIDFVFDDINEKWKKTVAGGVQGMSCIVSGGTYSGERCIGLGEQQCEVLRKSNIKDCPECKAAKWDNETQSCILPSSKSAQNLQRGINITMIVGGAIVGIVITVATVGTATAAVAGAAAATKSAIAFTAIETVGAGIEVAAQLKIDAMADDFLVESNKCKNATCAKKMLAENLQRMANIQNDMPPAESDAVNSELTRLANLIPDDDEIWATMLVKGTDMESNKLGFFDADSWEPEQVWRAVGIGLQMASLVTGITKWAISKSGQVMKSTATIKSKFIAAIDNVDRAQEGALTGNRLALKRKIAQMRAINPTAGMSDTDIAFYELWKKYAPRNQSFDDFKAMTNGNLEEMQQMAKNWVSWDEVTDPRSALKAVRQKQTDFLSTHPDAMELFQQSGDFNAVAEQYPEFADLLWKEQEFEDIIDNGFQGNYSTLNKNIRQISKNSKTQIETREQRLDFIKKRLANEVETGQKTQYEADLEFNEFEKRVIQNTTDKTLLEIGENVPISNLDDVALMRADQIHDIIESDDWLKLQKQKWYNMTTNEKVLFAQNISDELLIRNGVPRNKTTTILPEKLKPGTKGAYYGNMNVTKIDFDQVKDYEDFINVLAHENGGHALDYLNPNAGALGGQLHDATKGLFGESYDAYRAKPTEQTAWRTGEISSIVNSYDNSDLTDVLLDAIDLNKRIIPLDMNNKGLPIDYKQLGTSSPMSALWDDLFNPNSNVILGIEPGVENVEDIINVLQQSGKFKLSEKDGYWFAYPIK